MGEIQLPKPVCLIAAICYGDEQQKEKALLILQDKFGPVELTSEILNFSHTSYYAKEMGAQLEKVYFSFCRYVDPILLPDIKIFSNNIEDQFAIDEKRTVNIDPGYIEIPKLVLATTKNFSHRIYLGKGIYGDVQLYWQGGRFKTNPWTYPDYAEKTVSDFFAQVRNGYFNNINKGIIPWE